MRDIRETYVMIKSLYSQPLVACRGWKAILYIYTVYTLHHISLLPVAGIACIHPYPKCLCPIHTTPILSYVPHPILCAPPNLSYIPRPPILLPCPSILSATPTHLICHAHPSYVPHPTYLVCHAHPRFMCHAHPILCAPPNLSCLSCPPSFYVPCPPSFYVPCPPSFYVPCPPYLMCPGLAKCTTCLASSCWPT